jgi:hypothetical protein
MTMLWMDDARKPPPGAYHAKTAAAALGALKHMVFSQASLDHDLGDKVMDGHWMLRVAQDQGINLPPTVHLHTQNPSGRMRMSQHLEDIGYSRDHTKFATWHLDQEDEPS